MLSICVLAYHTNPDTRLTDECIQSIDEQTLPIPSERILVDNGSTSELTDYDGWRMIHLKNNRGNVEGQNICFDVASNEWVLFVSNDVRFEEGAIQSLWNKRFQGQLMPTILNPDMSIQSFGGRLKWPGYGFNLTQSDVLDYIPSITYLMPMSLWKCIGGFDTHFPRTYEDVDMGFRLGSSRLRCVNDCYAIHLGNATLKYKDNKRFTDGRIRFINKHYHGLDKWVRLGSVSVLGGISRLIHA